MAIMYRKYQNKNDESKTFGKWYARSVTVGTMTTEQLAEKIEQNCSMKHSDVLAVLKELAVNVKEALGDSKRVVISGLGVFKPVLRTKPAATSTEFNTRENVKSVNISFLPEVKVDSNGLRVKQLLAGCSVKELPKNFVVDEKPEASTEDGE